MILINFLSWREESRRKQKITLATISGIVAVIGIIGVVIIHIVIASKIDYKEKRILFLQTTLEKITAKMTVLNHEKEDREELIKKMNTLQHIQLQRFMVVRIFDEILQVIPEGVQLTKMLLNGDALFLEGDADSNTRIPELMNNINRSEWLVSPVLNEINKNSEVQDSKWIFTLKLTALASRDNDSVLPESEVKSKGTQRLVK